MPIRVICSACSAKLNVPDTAAGKRIKCPKCQAACDVPAPEPMFEVLEDADTEPTPTKAPKPVRPVAKTKAVDDDDEADDDEEERPRAKKKSRREDDRPQPRKRRDEDKEKPRKSPVLLIAGIAVLVVGVAFATYWFGFRGAGGGGGGGGGSPSVKLDAWQEYTSPDNVFKASFPGSPESKPESVIGQKVTSTIAKHSSGGKKLGEPSLEFFAGYIRFPESAQAKEIDVAQNWFITTHVAPVLYNGGERARTKVTVGGRTWEERTFPAGKSTGVLRWHQVGPTLHLIGYRVENQAVPTDAVEQFLASHQLLGGTPADPEPDPIPVSLENWAQYSSERNVFKAAFPGASKANTNFSVKAAAAEFREYTVKDDKSGATKKYLAGYARFATKPVYQEVRKVKEFLTREIFEDDRFNGQGRVVVGGWPWGEELRRNPKNTVGLRTSGVVRVVVAGTSVFAVGIKYPADRMPPEEEADKFFGAFEILAKPDGQALTAPPDWVEYRAPTGEFRAKMEQNVFKKDNPFSTGNKYAGVPITSLTEYTSRDLDLTLYVYVVRFAPNTPDADRQHLLMVLSRRGLGTGTITNPIVGEKIVWAGREGLEHAGQTPSEAYIGRETADASIGIVAKVESRSGPPNPDVAKAFFDSFSFDKK